MHREPDPLKEACTGKNDVYVYTADLWGGSHGDIFIFKKINEGSTPPHTHDFIEIVYVLDGQALQVVDDVQYTARRGDLVFMNYNSIHSYKVIDNFSYVNIAFYPEYLCSSPIMGQNSFAVLSLTAFNEIREGGSQGKVSFYGAQRTRIEAILDSMLRERELCMPMRGVALESYMNVLLVEILRKKTSFLGDKNEICNNLLEYIDNNTSEKLSLYSLAKKCFYNPSYFSRMFKEKFGLNLSEYIANKRMERACELLTTTSLPVNQIFFEIGFENKSAFYRSFIKKFGETPIAYRNSRKNSRKEK